MKKVLLLLIFSLIALDVQGAGPYYVKSTGGTCGGGSPRCTGLSTADDPGSGTNQACACKFGEYVLGWYTDGSSGGQAGILAGGETMIYLDETPTGFSTELCSGGESFSYGCVTRPIPSGSVGNTTKIYGVNHASCADDFSNTTKVWGRERAQHIFNLAGNDYIDFKCLDITDKSSCVYNVATQSQDGSSSYVCNRSGSYPLGNHADTGIKSLTGASTNITLDHVKITGLVNGIFAQNKTDWTANYLYIGFNSSVNWDNDVDGGGATTANHDEGDISLTNYTNVYAGCGEVWNSRGTPYYCTSQDQSGYGDGHSTGGGNNANYTFTDVTMHHNVSDDIDNLYDDGTSTTMKVIRGKFQGSSGQAIKSAAATTYIENTVAVGNCGYFKDQSFTTFANEQSGRSGTGCNNNAVCEDTENSTNCQWVDGDSDGVIDAGEGDCPAFNNCRAGSVLAFSNKTGGQKWYNINSTFYSNGDTVMTMNGANTCNGGTLYENRNSYFISGIEFNDGADKADFFYSDGSGTCADGTFSNVTGYNSWVINSKGGSGDVSGWTSSTWSSSIARFVGSVPLDTSYLTDADIIPNFYLVSATDDADETVSCQGDCSVDYQNYDRGASWDIGAIEYGSTPGEGGGGGGEASTGKTISGALNISGGLRL